MTAEQIKGELENHNAPSKPLDRHAIAKQSEHIAANCPCLLQVPSIAWEDLWFRYQKSNTWLKSVVKIEF